MIYLFILLYVASLTFNWLEVRRGHKKSGEDCDVLDFFLCICPVLNLIVMIALICMSISEKYNIWNMLFLVNYKKEENKEYN